MGKEIFRSMEGNTPSASLDVKEGSIAELEEKSATGTMRTKNNNHTLLRILGAVVAMGMLLWAIQGGFRLATTNTNQCDETILIIGILIMVFSFLFLALGFPILAELIMNITQQMQEETEIRRRGLSI